MFTPLTSSLKIFLGGDSAGGNLATALLLHIARPHPSVPAITLKQPLHSALLISPWICFEYEGPSFVENLHSDYLTVNALTQASTSYIAPGGQHDNYSHPFSTPVEWWKDVANGVVNNVMIWGGGGEVLVDGIRIFARNMKEGFENADAGAGSKTDSAMTEKQERVHFVVTPKQAHEEMIIDQVLFIGGKGEGAKEVDDWLASRLSH